MRAMKRIAQLVLALMLALLLGSSVGLGAAAAAPIDKERIHADVKVVVLPKSVNGGPLAYELIATNEGHDYARNMLITLPFDSAKLVPVDVKFSGSQAWVKKSEATSLLFQIPKLDASGKTVITIQFARLPGAPKDAALTERATFHWRDAYADGRGKTNVPQPVALPFYPMGVRPLAEADEPTLQFGSSLFAPSEPLTFWCNMPDGTVHELLIKKSNIAFEHRISEKDKNANQYNTYMRADENGGFTLNLVTNEELGQGKFSVVAYGHWTGLTAVGDFVLK